MVFFYAGLFASVSTVALAAEDAGHSEGGMPQLDFATWPSQIFWLIIAFFSLYFIMTRIALPGIGGVIEERRDAIEDDLDRAAEFKRKAEEAEAAYDTALTEARAKAQEIAGQARAEIQQEVDAAIAKADAEIAARTAEGEARIGEIRASASEAVETVAADVADALVNAVAPGRVDESSVRSAVAAALKG